MWNNKTYLETIKSQLTENLLLVKDNFSSLSEDELNKRPSKNSWSIGECLKHLLLFDEKYMEQIEKSLEGQDYQKDGKLFKMSLNGRLMMKVVKPDGKMKVRTAKIFKPTQRNVKEGILDSFERRQAQLMDLLIQSEEKNLRKIKVQSPVSSLLKFRLGEVFSLIAMHQRRHINQALRAKDVVSDD